MSNIPSSLRIGANLLNFPFVMGILNLTPDSFYEGSRMANESDLLRQAEKMLAEGAAVLDLGAYSSRPGATDISVDEEKARLIPAVRSLLKEFPNAIVSVDTFRQPVAERAIDEGAKIVNDISGGELDPIMFSWVMQRKVPYILMHMKGNPQNMIELNQYPKGLIPELLDYFQKKTAELTQGGCTELIIDPGFGFAKNIAQNFELLNKLDNLQTCGFPVLVGLSRKSMIYKTLGITPAESLNGTSALNMLALQQGAQILRVHDVREAVELCQLYKAMQG